VASVTDRLEDALAREAPTWGIRPVPGAMRRLSGLDLAVLWGDLSIGLLVLVTGALLVPALGLPAAVLAIGVGTVIGCAPLGLVAAAGAREGVPAMVLFRPSLGLIGSYLPSFANVVQLVGWTAFEFWAIGRVANAASRDLFGVDAGLLWLVIAAVGCTGLALAGPVFAVRRWLEKVGIWILLGVGTVLTVRVLTAGELGDLWGRPGTGGLPFWLAVDLVIAMPVSWLPLVADYTRFGRDPRAAGVGSAAGYAIGNAWFYLLGTLLVLAAGAAADPLDIGSTIAAAAGGGVVLLALLAGETDQAMANVYSSALTVQNVRPGWSQRVLIVAVGVIGFAVAAGLGTDAAATLEAFLLLIGSVFVPLFGVFLAHWAVLARGRYGEAALFDAAPTGIGWGAVAAWGLGFLAFQWCAPTTLVGWWSTTLETVLHGWLGLPFPLVPSAAIGGSLPGFAVAFAAALLLVRRRRQDQENDGRLR
jgi:putative hydroxymethylpyrimidine transporter CytX